MKKEFLEPDTLVLNFNEDNVVCASDNDLDAGDLFPKNGSLDINN